MYIMNRTQNFYVSARRYTVLLCAVFCAYFVLPETVSAQTTYTVTSNANDGAGSLREAITGVNNGSGMDEINVSLPKGSVIALTATLPTVTRDFILNGNGVTVDGSGIPTFYDSHILYIDGSSVTATISRIHFKNGKTISFGGAICNVSATLSLQSCIFSGNQTTASSALGGAIYTGTGTLAVNGCTFYGNSSGDLGGAIYNDRSTLTLTGNLFYDNTATGGGDVVYNQSGTVTSGGYNVYDGSSYYFTFNGTGDAQTSVPTVSPERFRLLSGSAVASKLPSPLPAGYPAEDFYGATVAAGGAAGAVQTSVTSSGYFLSVVSNNIAYSTVAFSETPDAEGLVPAGSVTLTATPVAGCKLSHWTVNGVRHESTGGTAQNPEYTFTLAGHTTVTAVFYKTFTVTGTNSNGAGSLHEAITGVNSGSGMDIIDVSLPEGSVIALTTVLPPVTRSFTLNGNGVTIDGSGIPTSYDSHILLTDGSSVTATISRVHFKNGKSGAINNRGATLSLQSCIFSGNQTNGAIYNSSATLAVNGCTFYGNNGSHGGAIYNDGTLTLTGNLFYGNTATSGDVVYSYSRMTSGGYNVYDGTSYYFTFNGTGDAQTSLPMVSPERFRLLSGSAAAGKLPSPLPTGYPAEDFYGATVAAGGAAGAVQTSVTGSGYFLSVASNNIAYGTVASSATPDAEGLVPAGSVTLTATPVAGCKLSHWIVNGVRHESTGGTAQNLKYAFTFAGHTTVTAVFYKTFTVTSTNNDGAGSLREAITGVNNGGNGGDVIEVNLPEGSVIALTAGLSPVTRSFTLNGNGVTIDGSGITTGNYWDILTINGSSVTATISRVHFKNGKRDAISNSDATLSLQSCIFSGNQPNGAIYNSSGTLSVSGCTFYGNSNSYGGAIANANGTLTLTGNLFYGNTATEYGNVVYNQSGVSMGTSGGYNVYDGTSYSYIFNGTGDVQTSAPTVSSERFRLLSGSAATGKLPSLLPAGYPAEDFYGTTVTAGGATGAVQTSITDSGYFLSVASNNIAYGTVASSVTPDAEGLVPAGSVTLTATPEADVCVYWIVNGVRHESTGGIMQPGYTFVISKHTTVRAVFHKVYTVTSTNNDGAGSLREAITDVNSGGGDDVIDCSPLAGQTIALTTALPIITRGFTLNGNGMTIDGSSIPTDHNSYILYINSGSVTASISRVHFKNGKVHVGSCAIRNKDATLSLQSCIFSGNQVMEVDYAYGGTIDTYNGTLAVSGCTFYGNSNESLGGTIWNAFSTLTLIGNLFYNNTATSGGDVVYNTSGTVTSGGYNVYDGASVNFTFNGTGDVQNATPHFNTTTFRPIDTQMNIVPLGVSGFPATDFYGTVRVFPNGTAGAVQHPAPSNWLDIPQEKGTKAWIQDETLHVSGLTAGKAWSVYSISGALLHYSVADSDEADVTLPARGMYVITYGGKSVKVVY
jgi:hypothetical protein